MRDWDAASYDRVAGEMTRMGLAVLDRVALSGDEHVVDAGCGTARVTSALLRRLPRGRVTAVDASAAMARIARERLGESAEVVVCDLLELELACPADVIFSTATFHWISDHDALFARLRASLAPGGRLIAQCGGAGNLADFNARITPLAAQAPYEEPLRAERDVRNYATAVETTRRLRRAGFSRARAWLAPEVVRPGEPREYLQTIMLAPTLRRLGPRLAPRYLDDVMQRLAEPLELDYVRLNIEAVR